MITRRQMLAMAPLAVIPNLGPQAALRVVYGEMNVVVSGANRAKWMLLAHYHDFLHPGWAVHKGEWFADLRRREFTGYFTIWGDWVEPRYERPELYFSTHISDWVPLQYAFKKLRREDGIRVTFIQDGNERGNDERES